MFRILQEGDRLCKRLRRQSAAGGKPHMTSTDIVTYSGTLMHKVDTASFTVPALPQL